MISVDLHNITSNHMAGSTISKITLNHIDGSTISKNSGEMPNLKHNDSGNNKFVVSSIPLSEKGSNTSIM